MKNLFSIFSIAALSFAVITSCAKEVQAPVEEEGINITIIGGDKDLNNDPSKTKTYVSEENDGVHVYWEESDKIKILEVIDNEVKHATSSSQAVVSDDGKIATFKASISSVEETGDSFIYTAIYPSECVSVNEGQYRVNIPRTQTLNGNNFASDADVLISEPYDNGSTRIPNNSELSYNFRRLGTTVKMTLKGISANEKLKKVEIESPAKISGYTNIVPAKGETAERGTTYSDLSLILDNYTVTGDTPIWFRVLSGTWNINENNPLVIKAFTDKASYSKTINSTKELVFAEGGLTIFGVGLGNRTVNPTIADGDYIIAAKASDNKYYAMSCEATGDRLVRTDVTEDFNTTEYRGDNYDLVWNFKTSSEGLAITTVNGDYLISSAKGASVGSSATYYSVEEKTVSEQKYYNIHNTSNYYLELNVGSGWYAFYNTDATVSMIRDLYVIPADVDKTPKIILDQSSVTLPCNTDSYDITFTKRFLNGEVTAEEASDPDNIVSNLSVEGNKVVVTLDQNTASTEKTATINICSEADDIAETFTLTLEKYVATSTDVITADMLAATSSSYTAFTNLKKTGTNTITSEAVYAGSTAKSSNNIQLNSSYGIWTTASGGLVSTVSVTYGNANSKNISVYGKNSAFSSNSTDGAELIGTLNANTLSVTATKDYEYILFKSNGATYPASLSITWKPKATVTGITVKNVPTTTEYHVSDKFDPTGLVITATYDDGSAKDIAYDGNESKFTFSPALDVALKASDESVTITYGEESTTQGINVYTWTYNSLVIAKAPTKTTYWEGESFDKAGMVVNAHYIDDKLETPNTKDEEVTDYSFSTDPLTAGTTSITLSKTIGDDTKTVDQTITVKARPEFSVTPSNNSAEPIPVGEGEYDEEPISVTAGEDVVWTVTKVSGADGIEFTEGGTSSGKINVMIAANTGLARDFVLRVSSSTDGVSPASYDVYLHQDAASVITAVDLATPTGLAYSNSTKKLTWNAVTTDVNGTALVGDTPKYNLTIDGNTVATNLIETQYDITTLSPKLAAGGHTATLVAVGDGTYYNNSASASLAEANFQVSYEHIHNIGNTADYTLTFTKLTTGTNVNSYTAAHDITIQNIKWSVFGNQSVGNNIRVGGKTTTATDRTLTSSGPLSTNKIGKVSITHSGIGNGKGSSISVNSIKIEGSTDKNLSSNIKQKEISTPSVSEQGKIDFQLDEGDWDANSYFRITVNYQITGSNNCYLTIDKVEFFPCSN